MKYKKIVLSLIVLFTLLASPFASIASTIPQSPALFETSLSFPVATTDTSMTLVSTTLLGGASLPAGYSCFTVDQGQPNTEYICGTVSGTVVSSLVRGIDPLTGNTSDSNLIFSHRRGADVKITDFPVLTLIRNILNGQDTLPGPITYANGVTPINNQDLATKAYVLSVTGTSSTSTSNYVVVPGTAGESLVAGNIVYLKTSDGRWYKTNSGTAATVTNTLIGISQSSGSVGVAIAGGVLIDGVDNNQTGLVAGITYYASSTSGALGTATTSAAIGQARSSSSIYLAPYFTNLPTSDQKAALLGTSGTPSVTNKYVTSSGLGTYFSAYFGNGSDGNVTISATTTLTRDMYYNNLTVNNTLITDGYKIFVAGTISGTSTITWGVANAGSNGGSGGAGAGGIASGSGKLKNLGGGAGNYVGGGAANGFAATTSTNGIGVSGGLGGSTGSSAGGTGGTVTASAPFGQFSFLTIFGVDFSSSNTLLSYVSSGGGGGGGGGTNSGGTGGGGGGGGTSGGIVYIFANNWAGSSTISVIGGAGGLGGTGVGSNANGGAGGGGGGGGVSVVIYANKTWTGSYLLTGGVGGNGGSPAGGGSTGGNGVAGSTGTSYEINILNLIR